MSSENENASCEVLERENGRTSTRDDISSFGKALASRAIYGSSSSSSSNRRTGSSREARTQPSRLSKVSLADDPNINSQ
ncbi:unnamed protein product [Prunus armeniaca]|uniref:Uncharacterized protein n=1 Tax=Prunus armeniaca TaxID=36596 RepID=A0A6J5VV51_PRUAR|nr:hypothetical protein GBA52_027901 [Prunus armeniaca]CAB4291911.1 unnamed protein product [Prunus armeniaca]CAB4322226.1 unnamed protein product [Prunus armeniaca]